MRRALNSAIECWERSYDVRIRVPDVRTRAAAFSYKLVEDHCESQYEGIELTYLSSTAYYIAFGPHGPRRPPPPDEGRKVFFLTSAIIAAAVVVFSLTRIFANPVRPRTMTKEWQEATEEYMKVRSCCGTTASLHLCLLPC